MSSDPGRLRVKCVGCRGTFVACSIFQDDEIVNCIETCDHCGFKNQLPQKAYTVLKASEPPEALPLELDFTSAKPYSTFDPASLSTLQTPSLHGPASAFENNITRLMALVELPVNLSWLSMLAQIHRHQIQYDLFKDYELEPSNEDEKRRFDERYDEALRMAFGRQGKLRFKGGKIDKAFRDDIEGVPSLQFLREQERVYLTGPFVNDVVVPVVESSVALIKAVDLWIARNPTPEMPDE